MKNHKFILCLFLALQTVVLNAASLTGDKIKSALDNTQEGVTFSAPGSYGKGGSWEVVSKVSEKQINGTVPLTGSTCLIGTAPAQGGYSGDYSTRNRTYFTVTVQGAGTLSYDYRAALDYENYNSFLWIYEYAGDNSKALDVDYVSELDTQADECWTTNTPINLNSEDVFWYEDSVGVGTDAYTHTITFAVMGKAKYDDWGTISPKYDDSDDKPIVDNKLYLDNFQWDADDVEILKLYPEDGTYFTDSVTATVTSDYDEEVFTFYYTTNGTMPTTSSQKYVESDEEQSGIVITSECTLWVRAYENATKSFVDDGIKATYYQNLPAPTISYEVVKDFSDTTKIIIDSNGADGAEYHYTLNGSTPTASSPIITSNTVMENEDLAGKTMQVVAVAPSSNKTSDVSNSISFERSTKPVLTWKIDGAASTDTYFTDNAEVTLNENWLSDSENGIFNKKSGKIQVAAFEENKISSEVVEQEFIRLDGKMSATKKALAPEEDDQKTWVLFTMPGLMREDDMKKLCAWLNPVAFDANKKALVQTETLEANAVYFVYMPGLTGEEPGDLLYSSIEYTPAGSGWQLVPTGAAYTLKNSVWKPVEEQSSDKVPGWKKQ